MKRLLLLCIVACAAALNAGLKKLSDDAIDWNFRGDIHWQCEGKEFCNSTSAGYVTMSDELSPYAGIYTFSMDVKLVSKPTAAAAESGIALISRDDVAEWRLLLRDNGRKRTAVLERYTGGRKIPLKTRYTSGKDFAWEYGKLYNLYISRGGGGLTGKVFLDGKELCRIECSDNNSLPLRGAFWAGGILTRFSNPAANYKKPAPAEKPTLEPRKPEYIPYRNVSRKFKSKATGYFHTKQDDKGYWWLIDPAGNAMFACGADGITWYGRHCEALGYSEFNRSNRSNFESELDWVKDTQKRLNSWGFNYAGTCAMLFRTRIPFAENLMIGSTFASLGDAYDISPYRGRVGTALPNPFHPRFEEYARKRFIRKLGRDIENPYLLGYYCDNELRWQPGAIDGSGVFDTVLKKRSSHTAKIALVNFLKEKFKGDIGAFNKFWNTSFADFDAILEAKKISHVNDKQLEVKVDFLAFTAETYFRKLRDTLKALDPNHLFLGCRYAGAFSAHPEVWKINGKYCDVVSFNIYPHAEFSWNRLFLNNLEVNKVLDNVYKLSGRPMMITEWAYNGIDSGLPCTNGAGQRFSTQSERARAAEMFYRTMLNHKGMIGVSWYEYSDDPALGVRRRHPENNNYGLVNKFNRPYEKLVGMFSSVNDDIDAARTTLLVGRDFNKRGKLYSAFNSSTSGKSPRIKITQNQQNGGFSVSNGEITIARGDSKTPVRYFLGKRHVGNIYFSLRSIGDNRVNEWSRLYGITNVKITHLASGAGISYTLRGKCKRGMFIADVRLLVPEKGKYCIAEILQVKNQTCDVLQIAGMYVLPEPLFERIQNVEPFPFGVNSGRRVDAWCAADGIYLGAASSLGRFAISFWQSEKEGCKYDAYTPMNTTLKKGEVHKPEFPAYLFVFSGKGAYNLHGKRIIEQDIK